MKTRLMKAAGVLCLLTIVLCPPVSAAQEPGGAVVLEGARLIDGTGQSPIESAALVIEGGIIRAAGPVGSVRYPKDARVIDARGKTITPALVNLHGHLGLTRDGLSQSGSNYTEENIRRQLEKYLAYGVGTVVSLGTDQDLIYRLREEQRSGALAGARLYTAGRGFGVKGGYPPALANAGDRYRPQTPGEARADVRELASHHPDFVKMWVDDDLGHGTKIQPAIYQAIIDEAHKQHIRVFAHEFYLGDAKALLTAGIDGFAHSIRDQPVDNEVMQAMKARGVFLIPTLVRDELLFAYADNIKWLNDPFFLAGLEPGALAIIRSPENVEKGRKDPDIAKYRAGLEMAKKNLKAL